MTKTIALNLLLIALAMPLAAAESSGFRVPDGFVVETFATDDQTGSALCLVFNSRGQLLEGASGSRGISEIRLLEDKNNDGVCDGFITYEPKIHCQGMCVVGSDLYAVGNNRLFLLPDKDGDGKADQRIDLSLTDLGGMGEHGPHGIVHGPDGWLYLIMGNASGWSMDNVTEAASPIRKEYLYWGNLLPLQSSNFMDRVGPPGGRILRLDTGAKKWEVVAAGFRNAYDLAFTPSGELFTFDSDMEWDVGLPWYRPVRICHVPFGAQFGWRYGSGKWKSYYQDSVPPVAEVGRGSPTGVECYDHNAFPPEYRGALFLCDWSRGRILCLKPQPDGASWKGEPEEFLAATGPGGSVTNGGGSATLPATDCVVGPDGALYVSYGGRGARGGVYRVRYTGTHGGKARFSKEALAGLSENIAAALNQPQMLSAYGRAAIAALKKQTPDWTQQLSTVAEDKKHSADLRTRALDLLGFEGDPIDVEMLCSLSADADAIVREHAAWRLGLSGWPGRLKALLSDKDPCVLRRACEGLQRHPDEKAADGLVMLLSHRDRFVRYQAQSALVRLPAETWAQKALAAESALGKAEGLLTWAQSFHSLNIDPQKIAPVFDQMTTLGSSLLNTAASADETLIVQRAIALTLIARGRATGTDVRASGSAESTGSNIAASGTLRPDVRDALVKRSLALLSGNDPRTAMEAAELLAYLAEPSAIDALVAKMKNPALPRAERIHYAVAAAFIPQGWKPDAVAEFKAFIANPGTGDNGAQFGFNLKQASDRLTKNLTAGKQVSPAEELAALKSGILASKDAAQQRQLIEKLAALGTPDAFTALQGLANEAAPYYDAVLTYLMRFKHAEAKKYMAKALASSSRGLAEEALNRLAGAFNADPKDLEVYYGLVCCASRAGVETRQQALDALKRWPMDGADLKALPAVSAAQVEFWQSAFNAKFKAQNSKSNFPAFPEIAGEGYQNEERFAKLVEFVKANPPAAAGNVEAGKKLFEASRCVSCHVHHGVGQMLGPDLSDVAKRFESAKILEDIVYPSRVVDARYRMTLFTMADGQRISGFVSGDMDDTIRVTDSSAVTATLKKSDVQKSQISELSIMPAGLVDSLKPEQVRDLLAFLESGK